MANNDLGRAIRNVKPQSKSVWLGPYADGVTFSMLSRFLTCRYRFKVAMIDGWQRIPEFNHRIEYGNMWHLCEEYYGMGNHDWEKPLLEYTRSLVKKYPESMEQIDHWYRVCKLQFPYYVKYWERDEKNRKPVCTEKVFNVKYALDNGSGRIVMLRGKMDQIFSEDTFLWLQENKTKSEIDLVALERQMKLDMQTMLYLTVLSLNHRGWFDKAVSGKGVAGVIYNVIRRPLSGGKGTIRRKAATKNHPEESKEEFYKRVAEYIKEEPSEYFARMSVSVSKRDIAEFRENCLDPILEHLCDWWDYVDPNNEHSRPVYNSVNWIHPYGIMNPLDNGYTTELDEYILNGNTVGLERVEKLFQEL